MDAGTRRVQRQLPHRDAHAVGPEIAQAEDALSVGDDDHADVLAGPVGEDAPDRSAIVRGDEEALRISGDVRELPAGLADGGRVDEWQDPIDVCVDELVEEPLVPLLQRRQQHVAIDVARQPLQVVHHPLHHLPVGRHAMREQSTQTQAIAVAPAERNRPVERLVPKHVEATFHGNPVYHGPDSDRLSTERLVWLDVSLASLRSAPPPRASATGRNLGARTGGMS